MESPDKPYFAPAPIDEKYFHWLERLRKVFGTLSPEFVEASMKQLIRIAVLPNEDYASSDSLSAALALISSLAPENEAQATLAIHVACLHMASLRFLDRSGCGGTRHQVAMGALAAKLERGFQTSLETYYRLRRGGTQIVRVERVEVQAGAQAIVGVIKR